MLSEILTLAKRMTIAGLDETEVAAGLVNFLKEKYNLTEGETYHDPKGLAGESQSTRIVCNNTFQSSKDSGAPLSLSDMAGNDYDY